MSYDLSFDLQHGCIFVRFSGVVTFREVDRLRAEIETAPEFRPGLNRLFDERDCRLQMSVEEIRSLAEAWRSADERHGWRKVAYVVSDPVDWGVNRMFETMRGESRADVGLFESLDEALRWLGLPADLRESFPEAGPALGYVRGGAEV